MPQSQNKSASDPVARKRVGLEFALEALNEGAYDYDICANTMSYSDRLRELLHVHASTLNTAEDWLGRIHPEDIDGYRSAMAQHFAYMFRMNRLIAIM